MGQLGATPPYYRRSLLGCYRTSMGDRAPCRAHHLPLGSIGLLVTVAIAIALLNQGLRQTSVHPRPKA